MLNSFCKESIKQHLDTKVGTAMNQVILDSVFVNLVTLLGKRKGQKQIGGK